MTAPDVSIPEKLQDGSFRFIRLHKQQKEPAEYTWSLKTAYEHNHRDLINHLKIGGNYGVICADNDVCILDADEYQRLKEIGALSLFEGQTLTIRTGNDKGERYHYYFRCKGLGRKKIPFFDLIDDKQHLGELYPTKSPAYCVGPGSIHPSGNTYDIVCDKEIKTILLPELESSFFHKVKSTYQDTTREKIPDFSRYERNRDTLEDILDLRIDEFGFPDGDYKYRANGEIQGANPIFGSTTGMNYSINPYKGVYHDFRNGNGGRTLKLIAIKHGFIAQDGTERLCDNSYIELKKAIREGLLGQDRAKKLIEHEEEEKRIWREKKKQEKQEENKKIKALAEANTKAEDQDTSGIKKRDDRDKKPITLVKVYTNEPPEIQMYKVLNGLNLCNCPPALFVRSGEMVRIVNDEHDYPAIERVNEVALRTRIYDCIEFLSRKEVKSKNEGSTWKENKIRPPIDVIRDVIHSRLWVNKFPAIVGITETPVIYPDGSILSEPGYDKETCLYYAPSPGLKIPPIPLEPSQEDVKKAIETIWEPFKEFTFVDKADGTHILAGLISIVCRNLINGNVPILLIDKPTPGTGASLISQIIGLISEGRDPAINSMPATEEEWKKQIISLLINGRPSVILDNIEGRLKSPALAALLTTQEYSDRLLGTNENVTYTHRMVWIGNGNNITLGGDLPRRSYWSRMDSESVRPWMDDKEYTHPDLRKWTMDNRGYILASILTITRSWIQAGRPKPSENIPKIGGFEQWRDVIGGILEHAGIDGFLGNLQLMYDTTDTETPQWDLFAETWFKTFKDEPQPTSEIFKSITPIKTRDGITYCNHQELRDSLPEMLLDALEREGSFTKILGNALTKRKDRRYPSGYMIKKAGEKRRAVQWKVVKIEIQSKLSPEDTR